MCQEVEVGGVLEVVLREGENDLLGEGFVTFPGLFFYQGT